MTAYSLNSMTGFARVSGQTPDGMSWLWELRSVNGKGLDARFRLPTGFEPLEPEAKSAVAGQFARGHITANLAVDRPDASGAFVINTSLLDDLVACAQASGEASPRIDTLLTVRGVVDSRDDVSEVAPKELKPVLDGLRDGLAALAQMRAHEGAGIAAVLEDQMTQMGVLVDQAVSHAETQPQAIKRRLHQNIAELLEGDPPVTEDRLAHEVALLVAKADIREEVDRLKAHLTQANDLMAAGKPCGRRLDFLAQELNREANTLCSKSQDLELTRVGLDLKALIEQWREQIQNIE